MSVNSDINKIYDDLVRMWDATSYVETSRIESFDKLLTQIEQLIEDEKQSRDGA